MYMYMYMYIYIYMDVCVIEHIHICFKMCKYNEHALLLLYCPWFYTAYMYIHIYESTEFYKILRKNFFKIFQFLGMNSIRRKIYIVFTTQKTWFWSFDIADTASVVTRHHFKRVEYIHIDAHNFNNIFWILSQDKKKGLSAPFFGSLSFYFPPFER